MRPWRKRFKHGHKRNNCQKRRKRCNFKRRFSPDDETRHHRKPRRLGGSNYGDNISFVCKGKHEAWHVLFDSLSAPAIFDKFIKYWNTFGESLANLDQIFGRINKKKSAWIILFGGLKAHQIVAEINDVWLDPAYRITAKFPNLSNAKLIRIRDGRIVKSTSVKTISNNPTYEQQAQKVA
jgi:hypothetical protein